MLDRALIVGIIIVSLGIAGLIGYVLATPDEPPAAPVETFSDTNGTHQPEPKPPQVFEKDIPILVPMDAYRDTPKVQERQTLRFQVASGGRVEGEVTVGKGTAGGVTTSTNEAWVFVVVRDPYGNIVVQHPPNLASQRFYEKYPWRFSFIASTSGEYSIEVAAKGWLMGSTFYTAHPEVTVYDE